MTIMHIPEFTAEASLYTGSIEMNITSCYDNSIVSPQITPQVLQNPFGPRPSIVVKPNCQKICFLVADRYRCVTIC